MTGLCLYTASSAAAATEFGDSCAGSAFAPDNYTLMTLSAPGQIVAAPVSGVITQVKINVGVPIPFAIPTEVKVLHPTSGNVFMNTEQTVVQAGPGQTTANVRMPVQAGDHLGLFGQPFTFEGTPIESLSIYCNGSGVEGSLGAAPGDVGKGSSAEFSPATSGRVPLAATVEPDADNDGYGDETQDKCPQSAAAQGPCPVVTLSTSSTVKKGLASILITTSAQATVTVAGTAKLGKGKTAKLNGGTQIVAPGALAKFVLPFPQKLQSALKALPKKRSLTLTVTASAPNVVGSPTVSTLKLHLKGQAKPKKHSHKKPRS